MPRRKAINLDAELTSTEYAASKKIQFSGISEVEWQATVVDHAERAGWMTHYTPDMMWRRAFIHKTPMKLGYKGFPDIFTIRAGEAMFLELKSEKGRLSPEQKVWRDMILSAGLEWHCWRPSDIDEVIERLWRGRDYAH